MNFIILKLKSFCLLIDCVKIKRNGIYRGKENIYKYGINKEL